MLCNYWTNETLTRSLTTSSSCARIVMKSWMNKFLEYWHLICIEHVHACRWLGGLGPANAVRCFFTVKSRPVLIVNDCAKMTGRHSAAVHKYLSQAFSPRIIWSKFTTLFSTWFHVIVHMIVYSRIYSWQSVCCSF